MSKGKRTCEFLKEVRQRVARENGIPLEIRECTHKGDCRGTCPYCEAEVRYLEQELSKHRSLGKAVTVAGIAVSAMMMSGCHNQQTPGEAPAPAPVTETLVQPLSDKTPDQDVPAPGSVDTFEMKEVVLGLVDDSSSNRCTSKSSSLGDEEDWDLCADNYVGDIPADISEVPSSEWVPDIEGSPAQYLKTRLTAPTDFLRDKKYNNAYIVLIISDKGEVKEVVFQPRNESPTAEEKAFYEDATRILKAMPRWKGCSTTASYEIYVRDLR